MDFLKKLFKFFQVLFSILWKILVMFFKFLRALFKGEIVEFLQNFLYKNKKRLKQKIKQVKDYDPNKVAAPQVRRDSFANMGQRPKPERQSGIDKFKKNKTNDIAAKAERSNSGKDLFLQQQKKTDDGNFAERSKHNLAKYIYLVNGQDRGRDAWHYVLVDPPKLSVFRQKTQGGSLDVADYGKVLFSGWGKTPPPEIKEKIKNEYLSPEARKREDEYEKKKSDEEIEVANEEAKRVEEGSDGDDEFEANFAGENDNVESSSDDNNEGVDDFKAGEEKDGIDSQDIESDAKDVAPAEKQKDAAAKKPEKNANTTIKKSTKSTAKKTTKKSESEAN